MLENFEIQTMKQKYSVVKPQCLLVQLRHGGGWKGAFHHLAKDLGFILKARGPSEELQVGKRGTILLRSVPEGDPSHRAL